MSKLKRKFHTERTTHTGFALSTRSLLQQTNIEINDINYNNTTIIGFSIVSCAVPEPQAWDFFELAFKNIGITHKNAYEISKTITEVERIENILLKILEDSSNDNDVDFGWDDPPWQRAFWALLKDKHHGLGNGGLWAIETETTIWDETKDQYEQRCLEHEASKAKKQKAKKPEKKAKLK